ncbi:hypothetical protein [Bosea minatitlanensis]|uniref:Uncharacterized protein n=1 Tax=Bosea minatitlanensis TaxID=128782 RepID=A0ABW0F3A3_9HYPH|nr:hypothetical protein [Bosea minatitlanensis]MCT4492769.1 hypothetical protein [Bosea minatitlanensis]
MRASDHRKHIPVGVKLHATLLLLGFSDEEIAGGLEWDHQPALALRIVDPETGELTPHPNDPRYLRPLRKAEHALKTRGAGATTAGSDVGSAAKVKRIEKDPAGGEAFRRRILAIKRGDEPPPSKRKRQWPTRPFPNRKRSKP